MNEKIEALPICEDVVVDLEKFLRMCEEEVKPHLIAWKKYIVVGGFPLATIEVSYGLA